MSAFQVIRRQYIALSSKGDPALKNLIEEEKDTVHSMRNLAKKVGEAANYFLVWGNEEHEDLKDLTVHFPHSPKTLKRQ
jgi:hypothetical protein